MWNIMDHISSDQAKTVTEKVIDEEDVSKYSHWYCRDESLLKEDAESKPNEEAIRKVQNSMIYYLIRDEETKSDDDAADQKQQVETETEKANDENNQEKKEENKEKKEEKIPNDLFEMETTQGEDDLVTVKYNRLGQKEEELVYFTIHIPDIKKKLLVSRELLLLESKVFEGMLNSEMLESKSNEMTLQKEQAQEGEKSSCEYFDLAMEFIHVGKLGVSKTSFNENVSNIIEWKDLLGLLRIADEYQIESLSRAISRVVNQFNALTIGITCLEFSADCKSIILPNVCDNLAFNPACVVSDMVYSGIPIETANHEEVNQYLEDPKLALKEYPFLDSNLAPPTLHKILATPLVQPLAKIIISLPIELFEGMMTSPYCALKQDPKMAFIVLWMLQDVENRYIDTFRLLKSVDWSLCETEILYTLIYFVFIGIGKTLPQHKSICGEAHDMLHMSMFRKNNTLSDEDWSNYLTKLFPEREQGKISHLHKELRFLNLGIDASGKTTLLYKLKLDEVVTTVSNL